MTTGRINQAPIVRFPWGPLGTTSVPLYASPGKNNTEPPGLPLFTGRAAGDQGTFLSKFQALLDQAVYPGAFTLIH